MVFFNLKQFEEKDLIELIDNHKKWDGYKYIKLNFIDRIILKEHKYNYNRMCIFGLYILCGFFIPFWILFGFILSKYFLLDSEIIMFLSFLFNIIIGIILEIIYQNSCDKIDYNFLVNKNQQLNLFKDWGLK